MECKWTLTLVAALLLADTAPGQVSPSGYRLLPEPEGQRLIVTVYATEGGQPIPNALVKVNRAGNLRQLGTATTGEGGRAFLYLPWDIHEVSIWTEPEGFTFNSKAIGLSGTGFDWAKLPVVPVDLYRSGPIDHALGTQGPTTFRGTIWGHTVDLLAGVTGAEVEFWFQFEAPPDMLPYDYEVLVAPRPTWAFVQEAADQLHINILDLDTGRIVENPALQRPLVIRVKSWLYGGIPFVEEGSTTGECWDFTLASWSHSTRSWAPEVTPITVLDPWAGILEVELEHLSPYVLDGRTEILRRKKGSSPPPPSQKPPRPSTAPPPLLPDPEDIDSEEIGFCKDHSSGGVICGLFNSGSTYSVASGQSYTTGGGLSGEVSGTFGYNSGVLTQAIAKVEAKVSAKLTASSSHSSSVTLTEGISHEIVSGNQAWSHCFSGSYEHKAVWKRYTFSYEGRSLGWIELPIGAHPCLNLWRDRGCDATHPECEGVGDSGFRDQGPCGSPAGGGG